MSCNCKEDVLSFLFLINFLDRRAPFELEITDNDIETMTCQAYFLIVIEIEAVS